MSGSCHGSGVADTGSGSPGQPAQVELLFPSVVFGLPGSLCSSPQHSLALGRHPMEGALMFSTLVLPSAPTNSSFTIPSGTGRIPSPCPSLPGTRLADGALCLSQFANATGRWLSFSCLFSWCPKPPPLRRQAVPKCERKLLRR